MRTLIFLALTFLTNSAFSEPKQLVCESSAAGEADRFDEIVKEYGVGFPEQWKENARRCREYGEFGVRNTYTFDTEGLSNPQYSKSEEMKVSCSGFNSGIVVSKLSATPNTISFTTGDKTFNIDRKTLKAGYNTARDFQCKLKDIDTSDNLI